MKLRHPRTTLVVTLLLPTLSVAFFHPAHGAESSLERVEAAVNSDLILKSDIARFRQTLALRQQLDPLFAGTPLASKAAGAPDSMIVDFLVDERLIRQQFPVTDAEVDQEINSIQASNHLDRATLRTALKEQGFRFEDYFDLIRSSVAKRNLIDRDIRTKVSVSDEDVKNHFYNTVARNSTTPRAYHVRIMSLDVSNFKSAGTAKETLDRALREVQAGESFEEVAKRVSDDPNASNGGDMGLLTEDQMSPLIHEQLKKMKIGEVSPVLGDPKSRFFILKLEDVQSAENDRFLKMKDQIRGELAASEYQRQIQLWLERERQRAFIHKHGSRDFATEPKPNASKEGGKG